MNKEYVVNIPNGIFWLNNKTNATNGIHWIHNKL